MVFFVLHETLTTLIYVAVGLYDTHSFECHFSLSSYVQN